jgi:hypothetical protein
VLISALSIVLWSVAAGPEAKGSGLLGSSLSIAIMGGGLVALKPWMNRHASDLPTAWLAASVLRVLAVPAAAFLLYFAIRPLVMPFVLGVVTVYLALLFVEVLFITLALFRQSEGCVPQDDPGA